MGAIACHTLEQTERYVHGYPHMAVLVDGHKDDKKPGASATRVFTEFYGHYHVTWPRLVAHAFARASGVVEDSDWNHEAVVRAASSTSLVDVDEARAIARAVLDKPSRGNFYENHKRLPHILRDLGMFAHDDVVALMVDMVGVKGAGSAPGEYFRENAGYVRPKLEPFARGSGPRATKANAALAMLR